MSDHTPITPSSPFDELVAATGGSAEATFTTAFRGYDKDEVDQTVAELTARLRAHVERIAELEEHQELAGSANAQNRQLVERLKAQLATVTEQQRDADEALEAAIATATHESRAQIDELQAELAAANARAANAEHKIEALTEEITGAAGETPNRHKFEEVLRVAEEQASVLLRNATLQGERLLEAAREEIQARRKEAEAEADAIIAHAQHDAQQARLRIDTELTAHEARIDREAAHAAEKISQAQQEAAAIRSEAEKGAAALRSLVARETSDMRAEAEDTVRELRARALEFEASLTRRQDDAQQEFLVLHNQAVAHAERITQDANEQVTASLEHAQRVSAKAEDFERLQRAQAQQIEADANIRAREMLDRARDKAQKIIDMVTTNSQTALRDAEDRTRQLRWQQQQLTSFMAEVRELIRPEAPLGVVPGAAAAGDETTDAEPAVDSAEDAVDEAAEADAPELEDAELDATDAEEAEGELEDADLDELEELEELEGEVVRADA